ncbi:hypothetical protein PG994_008330 [Apiospora phragmitis]|uniref:Uncharacterized protein n=1 Tax=Apiospora phragmitis TaxID=2905665 RepID=A0ABR1USQ3_9PEZI
MASCWPGSFILRRGALLGYDIIGWPLSGAWCFGLGSQVLDFAVIGVALRVGRSGSRARRLPCHCIAVTGYAEEHARQGLDVGSFIARPYSGCPGCPPGLSRLQVYIGQAKEVEDEAYYNHKEPRRRYKRQMHQLLVFAKALQSEVMAHHNPDPEVIRATIRVLHESFLDVDVWKHVSEKELRDELDDAVALVMEHILDMRETGNPYLLDDIKDNMLNVFEEGASLGRLDHQIELGAAQVQGRGDDHLAGADLEDDGALGGRARAAQHRGDGVDGAGQVEVMELGDVGDGVEVQETDRLVVGVGGESIGEQVVRGVEGDRGRGRAQPEAHDELVRALGGEFDVLPVELRVPGFQVALYRTYLVDSRSDRDGQRHRNNLGDGDGLRLGGRRGQAHGRVGLGRLGDLRALGHGHGGAGDVGRDRDRTYALAPADARVGLDLQAGVGRVGRDGHAHTHGHADVGQVPAGDGGKRLAHEGVDVNSSSSALALFRDLRQKSLGGKESIGFRGGDLLLGQQLNKSQRIESYLGSNVGDSSGAGFRSSRASRVGLSNQSATVSNFQVREGVPPPSPAHLGRRVKGALGEDIRDINGLERGCRDGGIAGRRRDRRAHENRAVLPRVLTGEVGLKGHQIT